VPLAQSDANHQNNHQDPIDTDAVVIGAGPVGLYQVFQLGLLGAQAHVIDALPRAGGQPAELYPDKPIYDLPGLIACTGQQLTDALLTQITPFKPQIHFEQEAYGLRQLADGRWEIVTRALYTDKRETLRTRALFIAAGTGAFAPKQLKLPGIEKWEGKQLFYRLPLPMDVQDTKLLVGKRVLILGGGQAALSCAIDLAQSGCHTVTLAHRRESFQASIDLTKRWQSLRQQGLVQFAAGQPTDFDGQNGRLAALQITAHDGTKQHVEIDTVISLQGLSPRLGPIADWGLALERKRLEVNPQGFVTTAPGIFAVGDINSYPGKRKLLVCGFHEATLAAWAAWPTLFPGQAEPPLTYTTSNTNLQQLLGVK
jgi:thioredoxin reductase (NADPH)